MNKPKIIHGEKLFGGRETAEDLWRRTVLGGKRCDGCGAPAVLRAITYAPFDEVMRREGPGYLSYLARCAGDETGMKVPLIDLDPSGSARGPGEKHVMIGKSHACSACSPAMEKALAKGPSWVLHHFDRGPGKDRTIFQVHDL